jgi:hypothetical protein
VTDEYSQPAPCELASQIDPAGHFGRECHQAPECRHSVHVDQCVD